MPAAAPAQLPTVPPTAAPIATLQASDAGLAALFSTFSHPAAGVGAGAVVGAAPARTRSLSGGALPSGSMASMLQTALALALVRVCVRPSACLLMFSLSLALRSLHFSRPSCACILRLPSQPTLFRGTNMLCVQLLCSDSPSMCLIISSWLPSCGIQIFVSFHVCLSC